MEQTFIIAEPDPIVSMDLAGTLKTAAPRSELLMVDSMAQARRLVLTDLPKVTALINASLVQPTDHDFLNSLHEQGVQIIFLGSSPEVGFEVKSIHVPFTSEMIVSALSSDAFPRPERPPEAHT